MLLACLLALVACGGGDDGPGQDMAQAAPAPVSAQAATPGAAQLISELKIKDLTPSQALRAPSVATAPSVLPSGDATAPTPLVRAAAGLTTLAQPTPAESAALGSTGPTAGCTTGYLPPASIASSAAAVLPAAGGVFYSAADLAVWRQRAKGDRFIHKGDVQAGTPGDWATISRHTLDFTRGLEPHWSAARSPQRSTHGSLLRDAAFSHLLQPDAALLAKLRTRLLAEAHDPANDFSVLCLRERSGHVQDAWFGEAAWLLRFIVAYDFVRHALPATERMVIDRHLRRNAGLLAAQLDFGLNYVFPQRHAGNYALRSSAAAARGDEAWASAQVDTNGDCRIDGRDDPRAFAAFNYVRADGNLGPRTSVLSQWFNNRKAINAATVGAAGVLLADAGLIARAKRYTMEWLSYGVWPDGSEGEYLRNGDYCIAKQGVIYAAANVQSALLIARLLARQGDIALLKYRSRDGLFGTESAPGQTEKSLALVAGTHIRLLTDALDWHQFEAHKAAQSPRDATRLGASQVHYMGDARGSDDYHELGLMLGARDLPALPIAGLVLRDPDVSTRRFPGSTGLPVATGFGSWVGIWTDAFNALPAMLLLH